MEPNLGDLGWVWLRGKLVKVPGRGSVLEPLPTIHRPGVQSSEPHTRAHVGARTHAHTHKHRDLLCSDSPHPKQQVGPEGRGSKLGMRKGVIPGGWAAGEAGEVASTARGPTACRGSPNWGGLEGPGPHFPYGENPLSHMQATWEWGPVWAAARAWCR